MELNVFPANPNEGDTVQVNGIYYIYTSGVWDVVSRVKSNIRTLVERQCAEAGLILVAGSFEEGGAISASNEVLWCMTDTKVYGWGTDEAKTVPANSTPATSGGIGAGAWGDRTDVTLRTDLSAAQGAGLVNFDIESVYPIATVGNKLQRVVNVDDFNDYYLVSSDWGPAFTAAFARINTQGNGGVVKLTPGKRYPVESSFNVQSFCRIKGGGYLGSSHGNVTNNFGTMPGIILATNATITLYGSSSLNDVAILRKGLVGYENGTTAFAGTAVATADGYDDQLIKESTIFGFALGISAIGSQRVTLKNLRMDNLSCVKLANSRDISRFTAVHCWPWVTVGGTGADILYRSGTAFEIGGAAQPVDWLVVRDCFAYCYNRGITITNASFPLIDNFAVDSDVTLTNRGALIGIYINVDVSKPVITKSKFTGNIGIGIKVQNDSASSQPVDINHCIFNTIASQAIDVVQGVVKLNCNSYESVPIGIAVESANENTSIIASMESFASSVTSPIYLTVDNPRVYFDDSCAYDGAGDIVVGATLLPFIVDDSQITTTLTVPKYSTFMRVNPTSPKTISYIDYSAEIGATIRVRNGGASTVTFDSGEIVATKTISTNQIATLTKVSHTEWLVY